MCGITCIFSTFQNKDNLLTYVKQFETFKGNISNRGPDWLGVNSCCTKHYNFLFGASVLWLQGTHITKQPLEDDKSVFIYNGDIFGGIPNQLLEEGESDTKILFQLLSDSDELSTTLSELQGPYAFVYLDKLDEKLYFGRDVYGRRSLLIGRNNDMIILSSVSKRISDFDFIELPSIGTFYFDLNTNQLYLYPWKCRNPNFESKLTELNEFLRKDIIVIQELNVSKNSSFINPTNEQLRLYQSVENIGMLETFPTLLNNTDFRKNVLVLKSRLENAVEKRITTQPKHCRDCIKEMKLCRHSIAGVLFSGGIDCAILALLADQFTEEDRSIDLINVAFDERNNYETPDRVTGVQTFRELQRLRPRRKWNFLQVNVPQEELNIERSESIADLIYPLQTILDDSLGCALWFASRAKQGSAVSPCRTLLVGMGADELFGGYTKHRAAFKQKGWLGLHEALIGDWQNLPYRNLARDDRVVSDHGRQLRTPYLDENVTQFVLDLNCWEKTYPSDKVPRGIGEKILLRSLGYYLGLENASVLKKRALQFGSRIANKKENAHDVSTRLCC